MSECVWDAWMGVSVCRGWSTSLHDKTLTKKLDRCQISLLHKSKAMENTPANVLLAFISIISNMEMPICVVHFACEQETSTGAWLRYEKMMYTNIKMLQKHSFAMFTRVAKGGNAHAPCASEEENREEKSLHLFSSTSMNCTSVQSLELLDARFSSHSFGERKLFDDNGSCSRKKR